MALPRARASQTRRPYLPLTSRRSVSGHLGAILSAPRRFQEASKLTFFGSRGLQERSKRPPRGFLTASASKMRFGPHFGPIFGSKKRALDLKNQGNPMYCRRFLWFPHFQLDSLLEPVLRSSWAPFGRSFGPQAMRNQSPQCPRAGQEPIPTMFLKSRRPPRGVQERPIRPWKPPLGRPSLFKGSKRPPRALQVASRAHLAAILAPCLINFEASSMRCCPCFSHASSLKAPSPRALDPRPKAWRNARERSAAHLRWHGRASKMSAQTQA